MLPGKQFPHPGPRRQVLRRKKLFSSRSEIFRRHPFRLNVFYGTGKKSVKKNFTSYSFEMFRGYLLPLMSSFVWAQNHQRALPRSPPARQHASTPDSTVAHHKPAVPCSTPPS
ncbi:hypothetical protein E2C01_070707 [Portunus trituberculatus]|uniref:Uncharacterized protein n=1 Tax=Portunus trituberculatus TaxID=210409 RepID=A0A5B7I482_PORTR|nr:hypothetical protein [Portunus trituberculatus]